MGVVPRHPHFAASDIGEFVENLHADRAATADQRFRPVGFRRVSGCDGHETLVSKKLPRIRLVPVRGWSSTVGAWAGARSASSCLLSPRCLYRSRPRALTFGVRTR